MADARELYDGWPSMSPEQKRKAGELLALKIVIREDLIAVDFRYLPTLKDMATSGHSLVSTRAPS